jgi:hypothetical protein
MTGRLGKRQKESDSGGGNGLKIGANIAGRSNGGFKLNERDIVGAVTRVRINGYTFAVGMEETEAGKVGYHEKLVIKLAADVVDFFRGGGGRANGNVIGVGLLDREAGELRLVLANNFFEVSEGLDFVQEGCVGTGKLQNWTLILCFEVPMITIWKVGLAVDMAVLVEARRLVEGVERRVGAM